MTLALILFLLILYYLISIYNVRNPEKVFIITATIIMILISGLRHEGVGNDTLATMQFFDKTINTSWDDVLSNFWERYINPNRHIGKDPGEIVFYKVLSIFTKDSRVLLFVVAIIVLTSFGIFIYHSVQSLQTILFSYIFYVSLTYSYIPNSSLRQSIAYAILLFAFLNLNNKKNISFVLLLLIASLFHKSVLIVAILLPFMYIKKPMILYWFCLLPFIIVYFNYLDVGLFLGGFNDIYESYLNMNYYKYHIQPFMVILMILGLYLFIGVALTFDKNNENNRLYIYGSALTLILVPLIRIDPSALRLISYFGVLMGIQVGNSCLKVHLMRSIFWIITLIFLTKAAISPDDGYRFMWQQKKLHKRYGFINTPIKGEHKEESYNDSAILSNNRIVNETKNFALIKNKTDFTISIISDKQELL